MQTSKLMWRKFRCIEAERVAMLLPPYSTKGWSTKL